MAWGQKKIDAAERSKTRKQTKIPIMEESKRSPYYVYATHTFTGIII